MERNRLARKWMLKYEKEKVIWGIFGLSILITVSALYLVLYVYLGRAYQILFLLMAAVISTAQFFCGFGQLPPEAKLVHQAVVRVEVLQVK